MGQVIQVSPVASRFLDTERNKCSEAPDSFIDARSSKRRPRSLK